MWCLKHICYECDEPVYIVHERGCVELKDSSVVHDHCYLVYLDEELNA